jgi:hypothetical protein
LVFDFDDFHEHNHRLDLLRFLHDLRPDFRCTLFSVPGRGSLEFWDSVPDWCELAVHGWMHPTPLECANWTYDRARRTAAVIRERSPRFVKGWKSPGWQTSPGITEFVDPIVAAELRKKKRAP